MRLFIEPREWRWVIIVSCGLALLAISPFFWVSYKNLTLEQDVFFVGALHDYANGAGDLARIYLASTDRWLSSYLHTPEPDGGALIDMVYIILGQLSRLFSVPGVVIYHVVRICAGVFMYLAIYQLAASIWSKIRARRTFFLLVAMGSGLGWLFAPLTDSTAYLDLSQPSAFPFYSTLTSVHLPLAIACLALLASVAVTVMRPDETPAPTVVNGGTLVFMASIILVLLYPLAFVPIALAFLLNIVLSWTADKRINSAQATWLLWFIVPPLPILLYYLIVFQNDTLTGMVWLQEIATRPPPLPAFLLSFGLPLLIAIPGLYRAGRRFERDGNQFMVIWLLVIVLMVYLPTIAQLNFVIGLVIPTMYFATRAIEDFWRDNVPQKLWRWVIVAIVPFIFMSNVTALFTPLNMIYDEALYDPPVLLPADYERSFRWLANQPGTQSVVLASPQVSLWIPAWAGLRVVYGHPTQTAQPQTKLAAVRAWYGAESCDVSLLNGEIRAEEGDVYRVHYVIDGPLEREMGAMPCLAVLTLETQLGEVNIYRYDGDG